MLPLVFSVAFRSEKHVNQREFLEVLFCEEKPREENLLTEIRASTYILLFVSDSELKELFFCG